MKPLALTLVCASLAFSQAIRFDTNAYTTSGQVPIGAFAPVLAIPGSVFNFCSGSKPASLAACIASPLTTYTDVTMGTPCPALAQMTLPQSATPTACTAVSDGQGNAGIWYSPQTAYYYLTLPAGAGGAVYGPYPFSQGVNGQSSGVTYNQGGSGAATRTVASKFQESLSVQDWGITATGIGTSCTDYSTVMNAMTSYVSATLSGGSIFFPPPANGKAYCMHGVQYYSHETFYSTAQGTTVQMPPNGWTTQGQVFTSGNVSVGGAALTDVHFDNFTVDGNKANQSAVPSDQDGGYGILLGGVSNSSVTRMVVKNNITDGIAIDGSGSATLTAVVNAVEATCTVSGVTWAGSVATYTCSAPHGMAPIAYVTVTGMTPSGYNQTACQAAWLSTTTFGCFLASSPGAYVSGGTATWSELQYVSGEPISNMQQTIGLTGGFAGGCVAVSVNQTLNSLSCTTDQGTHSSVTYTIPGVATGVGDNLQIYNNFITANERNGISQLCGTNTHIHDNHISYNTGILSGPWDGIDLEPFQYGCIYAGSDWVNNEIDHNEGDGIGFQPEVTYDPAFSPVALNINAHDNGTSGHISSVGIRAGGPFGPNSALTISGQFRNNGGNSVNGGSGVLLGWQYSNSVTIPWIVTSGSYNGVQVNSINGSAQILGGSISATGYDISFGSYGGYQNVPVVSGAQLLTDEGGVGSSRLSLIAFPFYGAPSQSQAFAPSGICYWPTSSPRNGGLSCAAYLTAGDFSNSPYFQASDGTVIAIVQAVTGTGAAFVSQGTKPAWIGSHNATYGAVGSLGINEHGLSSQPADTFANATSGASCGNLTQGYEANITDGSTATWAATVTGGGGEKVKIRCNGTNWTVEGN